MGLDDDEDDGYGDVLFIMFMEVLNKEEEG